MSARTHATPGYLLRHDEPAAVVVIAFVVMLFAVSPAGAGHFELPGMEGFSLHNRREADGDGDGVKETVIVQYLNPQGDSLVSMSTNGRLWAWSLDTNDDDSAVRNYVIRDSDCDGIFDEVYSLDEEFHVPECLK